MLVLPRTPITAPRLQWSKLLNSDNNFVKLSQIVKINRTLKQFKGKKLDNTETNLIKGLFKRRPQKLFNEDIPFESEGVSKSKAHINGPGGELKNEREEVSLVDTSNVNFLSNTQNPNDNLLRKTNKVGVTNGENNDFVDVWN